MSELYCVIGPATAATREVASGLLDAAHRVAIVSPDAAPFAMLVNEHGDDVLTIEVERLGARAVQLAIELSEENFEAPATVVAVIDSENKLSGGGWRDAGARPGGLEAARRPSAA